jgi:hypothetical protein
MDLYCFRQLLLCLNWASLQMVEAELNNILISYLSNPGYKL